MNWASYTDLKRDVLSLAAKLPSDIVGIVGVPRSGCVPAAMLALHLRCHLATVDGFVATGRLCEPGARLERMVPDSCGKILLLDDSAGRCCSINRATERIFKSPECQRFQILRGAVYATGHAAKKLDFYARIMEQPRIFEWNFSDHKEAKHWGYDFDGVLCQDCVNYSGHDSPKDVEDATKAAPLYLPAHPIGAIVSCRLEKLRPLCADWLARYGVRYHALHLYPADTPEQRRREGRHGEWKGEIYRDHDWQLFIESDEQQAKTIARVSGKPVLCIDTMQVYK